MFIFFINIVKFDQFWPNSWLLHLWTGPFLLISKLLSNLAWLFFGSPHSSFTQVPCPYWLYLFSCLNRITVKRELYSPKSVHWYHFWVDLIWWDYPFKLLQSYYGSGFKSESFLKPYSVYGRILQIVWIRRGPTRLFSIRICIKTWLYTGVQWFLKS